MKMASPHADCEPRKEAVTVVTYPLLFPYIKMVEQMLESIYVTKMTEDEEVDLVEILEKVDREERGKAGDTPDHFFLCAFYLRCWLI